MVDAFTSATCYPGKKAAESQPYSCSIQPDKERCLAGGGSCEMARDGYYIVNILCVIIGVVTFVSYIRPKVLHLQGLQLRAWRLAPTAAH